MNTLSPFRLESPAAGTYIPVLVTSPHSGATYSEAFLATSRLDAHAIRQSEDMFVDDLFAASPEHGAHLLSATFPRAFIDLNRAPYELEQVLFKDRLPDHVDKRSARASSGLGTIPRLVAENTPIYDGKLTFAEAEKRIEEIHQPFHEKLTGLTKQMIAQHGFAILLDAHSMPDIASQRSLATTHGGGVDFVLGDRFGRASDKALTQWIKNFLEHCGYRVSMNKPYAGGYITEHYGQPLNGLHALQIEINRTIYMDEQNYQPHHGYRLVQNNMRAMMAALRDDIESLAPHLRRKNTPDAEKSAAE
jgi:N-formylglutamate amidohydrolase